MSDMPLSNASDMPLSNAFAELVNWLVSELGKSPEDLLPWTFRVGGQAGWAPSVFTDRLADPTMQVFAGRRPRRLRWVRGHLDPDTGRVLIGPFLTTEEDIARIRKVEGFIDDDTGEFLGPGFLPPIATEPTTKTVGDLLAEFYTWDRDRLMEVQRLLYAGGFYGNVNITDIAWGLQDEDTFRAWATAVTRAARFFAAGEEITVDEVLRQAAEERLGMGGQGGGGGDQSVIELSDPLSLFQTLDRTAQSVLGRKATPEEQRMFVGIVHSLQRQASLARDPVSTSGPASSIDRDGDGRLSREEVEAALSEQQAAPAAVEAVQPSPEAQAEALLRSQNPTEAGAHDIARQFSQFLELLRGVV